MLVDEVGTHTRLYGGLLFALCEEALEMMVPEGIGVFARWSGCPGDFGSGFLTRLI